MKLPILSWDTRIATSQLVLLRFTYSVQVQYCHITAVKRLASSFVFRSLSFRKERERSVAEYEGFA